MKKLLSTKSSKAQERSSRRASPPPPPAYYVANLDDAQIANAVSRGHTTRNSKEIDPPPTPPLEVLSSPPPPQTKGKEAVLEWFRNESGPTEVHPPGDEYSPEYSVEAQHSPTPYNHHTPAYQQSEASSSMLRLAPTASRQSGSAYAHSYAESIDSEYSASGAGTVKYSFTPVGPNGMTLLPTRASLQGSQPSYYITVSANCFMPSSHVTRVYRGTDESAPRVCEFEMGIINVANSRLRMENYLPIPINTLLMKVRKPQDSNRWVWKLPNETSFFILWDCSKIPFTCEAKHAGDDLSHLLARFTSHIQPMTVDYRNPPPEVSTLDILPAGWKWFDDILTSLLIIERVRLTPGPKALFNY